MESFIFQNLRTTLNQTLGIAIDDRTLKEAAVKFKIYLEELMKWNRAYSLTSIDEPKAIVVKHFIDSVLYLTFVPEGSVSLADVGSGAGFPGIPIKIIKPELSITLIEPSWKKSAFLRNIKRKLCLSGLDIIQSPVEAVREKFNIIVSRALWSAAKLIDRTGNILEQGGFYILSKSRKLEQELKALDSGVSFEIREFVLEFPELTKEPIKRAIIKICLP